jgi:epoxyqueuosine reductase QueG
MTDSAFAPEIDALLRANGVSHWGVAKNDPALPLAPRLPRAISLLAGFRPAALRGVENGPTEAYFADYQRLNTTLNTAAAALARHLEHCGHRAVAVEATLEEYDSVQDWGDAGVFAHKTAATQAGLGWIGKTALFVSPLLGPKLRLATVFTDLDLPPGTPLTVGRCARCRRCVDACPAGAGRDLQWHAGMARDLLYDEKACERHLDDFPALGGVCGVCVAVCPFGRPERSSTR